MNRSALFDACEMHLAVLSTRISNRGKLNILNLHLHCEDFYAGLLNRLYDLRLKNMNAYVQNAEAIDLIDANAQVVLQVSATSTTQKVNAALAKDLSAYTGYSFRFMSIAKDAGDLRKGKFKNPHKLAFNPANDIYDVASLLHILLHANLSKQRDIYDYLSSELSEPGSERILYESNLASVINYIAKEDLDGVFVNSDAIGFGVDDKVAFNGLSAAAAVIEDYKVYGHLVDRIYKEFDNGGVNKSRSVLDAFRSSYLKLSMRYDGDELFFQIAEDVTSKVRESSNFSQVPVEQLSLSVNILAVDAFIRCKIFKKPPPTGVAHAVA